MDRLDSLSFNGYYLAINNAPIHNAEDIQKILVKEDTKVSFCLLIPHLWIQVKSSGPR